MYRNEKGHFPNHRLIESKMINVLKLTSFSSMALSTFSRNMTEAFKAEYLYIHENDDFLIAKVQQIISQPAPYWFQSKRKL